MKILFICIWLSAAHNVDRLIPTNNGIRYGYDQPAIQTEPAIYHEPQIEDFGFTVQVTGIRIYQSVEEVNSLLNEKQNVAAFIWQFSNPDAIYSYNLETKEIKRLEIETIEEETKREITEKKIIGYRIKGEK